MNGLIVQGIGFIGVLIYAGSYQVKSNKGLFIWQMAGSLVFILQMFLLGGISGCFGLALISVRNLMLAQMERWPWVKHWGVAAAVIAASFASTVFTWNGFISILPFIALAGGTIGYWTDNARTIRLANLVCCSPAWIIYDIAVGTIAGTLSESFTMISILVSIYRYGWKSLGANDFDGSESK